jgi:DNA-binding beta-propeller fold protein YncE
MKNVRRCALVLIGAAAALWLSADRSLTQTPDSLPMQLEAKIPLGNVKGRIDHMAVDLDRQHLFVAELGNDSVGVVDLRDRKLLRRITDLKEPQGVAYVPSTDTLYVSNAGDGSVRLFRAEDFAAAGRVDLADDADNIRLDARANRVFVGYGSGALAVIDAAARNKIADIPLKAHPESFQLDSSTGLIFVNLPKAREIAVVDRAAGKQIMSWSMRNEGNFPMALDENAQRVLAVFRRPATLGVFSMRDGSVVARVETCGDADDLFIDAKRRRVYVSCGEGFLDVFEGQSDAYRRVAHLPTIPGARTSLFVPEMDRLLVAARAASGEGASIWIFRPTP